MTQPSRVGRHAAPDDSAPAATIYALPRTGPQQAAPALAGCEPPPFEPQPDELAPVELAPGPQPGDFISYRPSFAPPRRPGRRLAAILAFLLVVGAGGAAVWWFRFRHSDDRALDCEQARAGIETNAGLSASITSGVAEPTGIPLPAAAPEVTCGGTMTSGYTGGAAAVTFMGWRHLDHDAYEANLIRLGWTQQVSKPPCAAYLRSGRAHIIVVCAGHDVQVVGYLTAAGG